MLSRILALTVLASAALGQTSGSIATLDASTYVTSHNNARTAYGVANVTDLPSLLADTEAYVSKCVFAHSGKSGVGENLAACGSSGGYPYVIWHLRWH